MSQQNGNENKAVQKFTENTVENVLAKISGFQTEGGLRLPPNYSAENCVRSAWLMIQEVKNRDDVPALTCCTTASIANALLDMVLQGLNPVKKQCYFIVYGNQLVMQRSYIGNIAIGRRVAGIKEVKSVPVYEGEEFAFEVNLENGRKRITKHAPDFSKIDPDKVIGAYAIITDDKGNSWAEVMTIKQIRKSWEMGKALGKSKAHNGFADEMACKTVINRALKTAIGSSDDGDLFEEELPHDDVVSAHVKHQISENANQQEIAIEPEAEPQGDEYEEVGAPVVNEPQTAGPNF